MANGEDTTGVSRRALVVEDDHAVRRLVVTLLSRAGLRVDQAGDGAAALALLAERRFDVVLLDVGIPRPDGWEVLSRIRAVDDVPVLMLTGHSSEIERVRGLRAGADDYVAKPFGRMELVARVDALLRRRPPVGADRPVADVFDDGCLRIDPLQHRAWWRGEELALAATEFRLLLALVEGGGGRTVGQEALAAHLWGDEGAGRRAQLRSYVGYIRRKLGDPEAVVTVHGVGYRYVTPAPDPSAPGR